MSGNRKKFESLKLIVIGAHPGDCELKAGATAALAGRAGSARAVVGKVSLLSLGLNGILA